MAATHQRNAIGGQNPDKAKWVLAWPGWTTAPGGGWPIAAPTAQASATTDANYDPAIFGFRADTYDTLLVCPQFSGGGTVTIEAMVHDEEMVGGAGWVSWIQPGGGKNVTPALATGQCYELKTAGRTLIFFRISAIGATVTNLELVVAPGAGRIGGFTRP